MRHFLSLAKGVLIEMVQAPPEVINAFAAMNKAHAA